MNFILKELQNFLNFFKKYITFDFNYIINHILPEFLFLLLALIIDLYIRRKYLKRIKLSHNVLVKDLQIFSIRYLSRSVVIFIFSSIFTFIQGKQGVFLNQIATSFLIFGFFKFIGLTANNVNIEKFGSFLTIVAFIYSFSPVKIAAALSNVKFNVVIFEISLFVILKTLVKISIFYCIISVNEKILNFVLSRFVAKSHTRNLVKTILTYIVYAFLILNISTGIGIQSSHLAMIGSAIGLGIGFGFQKFASNFISGMLIMSENKFRIGDLIILNDGTWGYITEIDTRTTIIETMNQEKMLIPNETMLNSTIKNLTLNDKKYNIKIDFKLAVNTDLREALNAINKVVEDFINKKYILKNSYAKIDDIYNDGKMLSAKLFFEDIEAKGEFNPWAVKSHFLLALDEALRSSNIEFAFIGLPKK